MKQGDSPSIYIPTGGTYRLVGVSSPTTEGRTSAEILLASLGPKFLTFGFLLLTFRTLADIKLRPLADMTGIDIGRLSRYENNKVVPEAETIAILEKALGPEFSKALALYHDVKNELGLSPTK